MLVTSHFLAVSLNPVLFVDLFIDLQSFFRQQGIEAFVELQNPLSIHVTLYYLPQVLTAKESEDIHQFLAGARKNYHNLAIYMTGFDFFKMNLGRLCYLIPSAHLELKKLNHQLRTICPNEVVNNKYDYQPHVTLFQIKDTEVFTRYADQINDIITSHIPKLQNSNSFYAFNLYAVNSKYSPQVQLVVTTNQ